MPAKFYVLHRPLTHALPVAILATDNAQEALELAEQAAAQWPNDEVVLTEARTTKVRGIGPEHPHKPHKRDE
jgi:hypothetical protein